MALHRRSSSKSAIVCEWISVSNYFVFLIGTAVLWVQTWRSCCFYRCMVMTFMSLGKHWSEGFDKVVSRRKTFSRMRSITKLQGISFFWWNQFCSKRPKIKCFLSKIFDLLRSSYSCSPIITGLICSVGFPIINVLFQKKKPEIVGKPLRAVWLKNHWSCSCCWNHEGSKELIVASLPPILIYLDFQ